MNNSIVSVIIPTFNRLDTTVISLESVLKQSFQAFDVIVVDDCSTDDSFERLSSYTNDSRVRLIRATSNCGAATCRNMGADMASGSYLAFLDSDDIWLPGKLDAQMDLSFTLTDKYADFIVYSPAYLGQKVRGANFNPVRPMRCGELVENYLFIDEQDIQTSGWLMPAKTFAKVRFSPGLRRHQDLDFCLRAQSAGIRFFMTKNPQYSRGNSSADSHVGKIKNDGLSEAWIKGYDGIISSEAYYKFILGYIYPALVLENADGAQKLASEAIVKRGLHPAKAAFNILVFFMRAIVASVRGRPQRANLHLASAKGLTRALRAIYLRG